MPAIRDATAADLDAINAIFNHYVLNSTCTFAEDPLTAEQRREWWREHAGRFPVLALHEDLDLLGWACLSPFRPLSAYRNTAEDSVYLRPDVRGRGYGKTLLVALLERGRAAGFHTVIAAIVADQPVSLRLHAGLGFTEVARLREVGFKFGRRLDVIYMQRML
jgi:phosphinothricin acetyltransferase